MSHSVFTIVTTVRPDKEQDLRDLLAAVRADPFHNAHLSFGDFPCVHFASFTIFPDKEGGQPTLLVFENNIDGDYREYLTDLARRSLPGLTAIYRCCQEPLTGTDSAAMRRYLMKHRRAPHLYHVGTPYRRATTVRADKELQQFLDQKADLLAEAGQQSPSMVWQMLRTAASVPTAAPSDQVARIDWTTKQITWTPNPESRWPSRLLNWLIALALGLGAVALLAWLNLLFWPSQTRLTAMLVLLFTVLGVWTSILIGWPVRRQWRHPLNIVIWFGVIGWAVSLIPEGFRLVGLSFQVRGTTWIAPSLLALFAVIVLGRLRGMWTLPTPELDRPVPSATKLTELTRQEDHDVNNHMSAIVPLRPGLYRRISLWILLWTLKCTWFRTVLRDIYKGRLFNFATVHFAQWVMLDDTRYLFLSNFDHSWSRYLDDFGFITFGLARLWGQGKRSPGLSSLEHFKNFSRTWMEPYEVWYRAYPDTSVTQIWNNEKIRQGLLAGADDAGSRQLLARLVASEER
jgi:hypothetical protein